MKYVNNNNKGIFDSTVDDDDGAVRCRFVSPPLCLYQATFVVRARKRLSNTDVMRCTTDYYTHRFFSRFLLLLLLLIVGAVVIRKRQRSKPHRQAFSF